MFGPDLADSGHTGIQGRDGEITGMGGAVVAVIAKWSIRRSGSYPDGRPKLQFRCWTKWRNDVLWKFCANGTMKGRVRVFMLDPNRKQTQIDIVLWDEWKLDGDNNLILENIQYFDTAPLKAATAR